MCELVTQVWEAEGISEKWKKTIIVPIYKKEIEISVRITGE